MPTLQRSSETVFLSPSCARRCTVCDTRSAKKFSEHSYRHGVVVVKCPGCQNHHLIADNLGFFEEEGNWNIETLLRERGDDVVDDDNLMAGISPERLRELIVGTKVGSPEG